MPANLYGARLAEGDPWVEVCALPLAMLLALVFTTPWFGRMLIMPVQIQFHELGHALPAWLSSRAALPLPFGFTFFSEEPSLFTGLCMLFLLGVFGYRSLLERRWAASALGGALLIAFAWLSLFASHERSRMLVLAGGFVGELALSALMLIAFYLRFPDRLRWDFFRFVALVPSSAAWLTSARTWRAIARKDAALSMRSFLPGDGNGDFERLIAEYDFTIDSITRLGMLSVRLSALAMLVTYLGFAARALRRLRQDA